MHCIGRPVYTLHDICLSHRNITLLCEHESIIMPFSAKLIVSHSPDFVSAGCKVFYLALFLLYSAVLSPFFPEKEL